LTDIKAAKVRLVLPEGHVVVDKTEATQRAEAEGLDLVLVQEGEVPVVKLCDFRKLEYQKQKSVKLQHSKKAKQVSIGPHTHEHDLQRLAKQASEFLADGHPTSIRMEVKGRDRMFKDLLRQRMEMFAALIGNAKPGRITESEQRSCLTYYQPLTWMGTHHELVDDRAVS
jgi:translation initiation factor IF-3